MGIIRNGAADRICRSDTETGLHCNVRLLLRGGGGHITGPVTPLPSSDSWDPGPPPGEAPLLLLIRLSLQPCTCRLTPLPAGPRGTHLVRQFDDETAPEKSALWRQEEDKKEGRLQKPI